MVVVKFGIVLLAFVARAISRTIESELTKGPPKMKIPTMLFPQRAARSRPRSGVAFARCFIAFFAIGMLPSLLSAQSPDFDLVILGGRVIDPETKLDANRNVGVKDGMITAITENAITGKQTINADRHVVAPGFLDMHDHTTAAPFGQKLALRDGVTTPMELELGVYLIDEWYAALKGKSQSNYGASAGTMPVRETIFNPKHKPEFAGNILFDMQLPKETRTSMAWSTHIGDDKDFQKFRQMLEEALNKGAVGVGHVPGYMMSGLASYESNIAQQLAGKHGVFVALHGRE